MNGRNPIGLCELLGNHDTVFKRLESKRHLSHTDRLGLTKTLHDTIHTHAHTVNGIKIRLTAVSLHILHQSAPVTQRLRRSNIPVSPDFRAFGQIPNRTLRGAIARKIRVKHSVARGLQQSRITTVCQLNSVQMVIIQLVIICSGPIDHTVQILTSGLLHQTVIQLHTRPAGINNCLLQLLRNALPGTALLM